MRMSFPVFCHTVNRGIHVYSETWEGLKTGRIKAKHGEWPAFLYDHKEDYDQREKEKGLLRGYLLVRVSDFVTSTFIG